MRSMVEGACSAADHLAASAPTTALRAVPLPRVHGGGLIDYRFNSAIRLDVSQRLPPIF
jgi:hypothetical protein